MLLYHITSYKNIYGIISKGGLVAKNLLHDARYESIAYENIQDRRHHFNIPFYPNETLHDYVPFHFAPRSPMLYTIKNGNVQTYNGTQRELIYLVAESDNIVNEGYKCVFTDGHPIMRLSKFYSDYSYLEVAVDSQIMQARYWADTEDDNDRKRRRQAEFLVYHKLCLGDILYIAVYDSKMQDYP